MSVKEHFERLGREDNAKRRLLDSSENLEDLQNRFNGYVKQAEAHLRESGAIGLMRELEQHILDSELTVSPGVWGEFAGVPIWPTWADENNVFAGAILRWGFSSYGGGGEDQDLGRSDSWSEFGILANAGRKVLEAELSRRSTFAFGRNGGRFSGILFLNDPFINDDFGVYHYAERERLFERAFSEIEWRDKDKFVQTIIEALYTAGVRISLRSKDEIRKETEDTLLKTKRRLEDSGFLELIGKVLKVRPHSKMFEYRKDDHSFTVVLQWDGLYIDDSGEWPYTGDVERWGTYYRLEATATRGDVLLVKCILKSELLGNAAGPKTLKTFIEKTFYRDDWQDKEKFEQTLKGVLWQTGVRLPTEGS